MSSPNPFRSAIGYNAPTPRFAARVAALVREAGAPQGNDPRSLLRDRLIRQKRAAEQLQREVGGRFTLLQAVEAIAPVYGRRYPQN